MKKIKLAVLALGLLMGFAGAYGKSKKAVYTYWAQPNASTTGVHVYVSATPPSAQCVGGSSYAYICRFSSEEVFSPGEMAWVSESVIISTYGN
ncbi:hypothetical protein [Chitinophaga barathri]|uniref:hypothetical protein n=1 Tax=Chitinophaga barathri TaxID=1647451 RepID=UPI000F5091E0|nr:hypothetical protein [Chitinophaga barathri]